MKYERRRLFQADEPWLPIIGTGYLATIKELEPELYERLLKGETIKPPYRIYEYRLRKDA